MADLQLALSASRRAVDVAAGEPGVDVRNVLSSLDPPVRSRRVDGRLQIGFDDAGRLLDDVHLTSTVAVDSQAARAIENRRDTRRRAPAVLAEARAIIEAGPETARQRIEDSDIADQLDDHQAVNVAVMTIRDGWGTCVFDEQGTGKTPTTIAAFDLLVERNEAETLVVVAPKSMVAEWGAEFRRFFGSRYRVAVTDGDRREKARAIDSGAEVIVINYETAIALATNLRLMAQRTRVVLAVDESFFVKNPEAARSSAVAALREWCVRCFVLCGTPAPNSPHDLVAQFDLVDFGYTFAGHKLDDDRDSAAEQVRAILDSRGLFLRSLKRSVLPSLPGRDFVDVGVELAPQQALAYRSALEDLILDLTSTSDDGYSRSITSYLERRATLLRICSDPTPIVAGYDELPAKIAALDDLLSDLVEARGEKVIIWSFYRSSLNRIADRYSRYGLVRIDGSVGDVAERREAVRKFQEDDSTMVFLGNPAAAGAGLTLHRSRVAIYESLSNQAAHYLQSLDRIHRRGQDREVEYFALLCRGTVEETEYQTLLDKADRQADLLGDPAASRPTRSVLLAELVASRARLQGE